MRQRWPADSCHCFFEGYSKNGSLPEWRPFLLVEFVRLRSCLDIPELQDPRRSIEWRHSYIWLLLGCPSRMGRPRSTFAHNLVRESRGPTTLKLQARPCWSFQMPLQNSIASFPAVPWDCRDRFYQSRGTRHPKYANRTSNSLRLA